jgi:hypothetical protein
MKLLSWILLASCGIRTRKVVFLGSLLSWLWSFFDGSFLASCGIRNSNYWTYEWIFWKLEIVGCVLLLCCLLLRTICLSSFVVNLFCSWWLIFIISQELIMFVWQKREAFPDLAPMLWHSCGTIAALLQVRCCQP